MKICAKCAYPNRDEAEFCEQCGISINGKQKIAVTQVLNNLDRAETGSYTFEALPPRQGDIHFKVSSQIQPLIFSLKNNSTIVIGRAEKLPDPNVQLDLTPYAGYKKGVSRRHAEVRKVETGLEICDLGSSNGTFLRGKRLSPHQSYPLEDGDEIEIGQLRLKVFFQEEKPLELTKTQIKNREDFGEGLVLEWVHNREVGIFRKISEGDYTSRQLVNMWVNAVIKMMEAWDTEQRLCLLMDATNVGYTMYSTGRLNDLMSASLPRIQGKVAVVITRPPIAPFLRNLVDSLATNQYLKLDHRTFSSHQEAMNWLLEEA